MNFRFEYESQECHEKRTPMNHILLTYYDDDMNGILSMKMRSVFSCDFA
jgi:hypothetical protein